MERIIHNRARCLVCGDIIESKYRNDFRTCSCGNLSVDGGQDYIRRGYLSDMWENMNVIEEERSAHGRPDRQTKAPRTD